MRSRLITILFILSTSISGIKSQIPEIGIFGGGSYYIGDLNPYKHFYQTRISAGAFYRNQIKKSDQLTFRIHLMYGSVQAFDSESSNSDFVNRNLSFKSQIIEVGPMLEIHFLPYEIGNDKKPGTPYLFFGLTYFRMNPMGAYNDGWIDLQSLGTEGQGSSQSDKNNYRLSQLSIPLGVGVKFNISERMALGAEYAVRKTFTDFLDDVSGNYPNVAILAEENGELSAELSDRSLVKEGAFGANTGLTRGNPNNKDWYTFFGLTLSYRIKEYTTCSVLR